MPLAPLQLVDWMHAVPRCTTRVPPGSTGDRGTFRPDAVIVPVTMRPLRLRVVAALLALGFMGGMGGVSDLDALLFHRGAAMPAGAAQHVEASHAAGCHADRCVLALRLASSRVAPRLGLLIRFDGIPQYEAIARPAAAPHRATANHQQRPRAPPASIA